MKALADLGEEREVGLDIPSGARGERVGGVGDESDLRGLYFQDKLHKFRGRIALDIELGLDGAL